MNIQLLAENLTNATVVPTAAIQHGSNGDFVYLLSPNFTVTTQPVNVGVTRGDDTVIQKGLTVGQNVVIDGADKLMNGAKVKITGKTLTEKRNT